MSRILSVFCAMGAAGIFLPSALAQDTQVTTELRELRQSILQQSKQIEALTEQVGKLRKSLEGQGESGGAPTAAPETENPLPESGEPVPRAEAVPKHIVVKGETLTSIAKHYIIPLAELQKVNKIDDGRKLQIGQTLLLPLPKNVEPPAEKKENP